MAHLVSLPATNKRVCLGDYVRAIHRAKASPDQEFRHGLTTWWPVTGADVVAEFRAGMADRINRHIPWFGIGRKWRG